MTPDTAAQIPPWFWALFFVAFGSLVVYLVRRELSRIDELPRAVKAVDDKVNYLGTEVAVIKTQLNVRDDILDALDERDRRRAS